MSLTVGTHVPTFIKLNGNYYKKIDTVGIGELYSVNNAEEVVKKNDGLSPYRLGELTKFPNSIGGYEVTCESTKPSLWKPSKCTSQCSQTYTNSPSQSCSGSSYCNTSGNGASSIDTDTASRWSDKKEELEKCNCKSNQACGRCLVRKLIQLDNGSNIKT